MWAREQLIDNIRLLPEHTVQAISIIIKDIVELGINAEPKGRPVFGSGKGQMWFADDFDAPLDELKEYME